jgi:hypothetical protein
MTIKEASIIFLNETKQNEILVRDFFKIISNMTGYSTESIRGSSLGLSNDKFVKENWFTDNFVYLKRDEKHPARIVSKNYLKNSQIKFENYISYNSVSKNNARKFIFNDIKNIENPIVLTMAGECGFDVKLIKQINKRAIVYNVERDENVLSKFIKRRFVVKNFNCTMHTFLLQNDIFYDVINYDSVSYLCGYLSNDLKIINSKKSTNILALTLMNIKKIRNHGSFSSTTRTKYIDSSDPTFDCIQDILSNYIFIGEHIYNRTDSFSTKMRVLKFKIK